MFTGLIQTIGRVMAIEEQPTSARLYISYDHWDRHRATLHLGDSVSVSGVCLTVVELEDHALAFDVVPETLAKTTLGRLKPNDRVNLETAVTPTTPMGGHFVQGHIDGTGMVAAVHDHGPDRRLVIRPQQDLIPAIIPKGSVAVDGVSLTVAAVNESQFDVALIPTTLEKTTLADLATDQTVNLETDIISKTVIHYLRTAHP